MSLLSLLGLCWCLNFHPSLKPLLILLKGSNSIFPTIFPNVPFHYKFSWNKMFWIKSLWGTLVHLKPSFLNRDSTHVPAHCLWRCRAAQQEWVPERELSVVVKQELQGCLSTHITATDSSQITVILFQNITSKLTPWLKAYCGFCCLREATFYFFISVFVCI